MKHLMAAFIMILVVNASLAAEGPAGSSLSLGINYHSLDSELNSSVASFTGISYSSSLEVPIFRGSVAGLNLMTRYRYMNLLNAASNDLNEEKISGSTLTAALTFWLGALGVTAGVETFLVSLKSRTSGITSAEDLTGVIPFAQVNYRFKSKNSNLFIEPSAGYAKGILKSAQSQYRIKGIRFGLSSGFEF